jgi:hypothetical protein
VRRGVLNSTYLTTTMTTITESEKLAMKRISKCDTRIMMKSSLNRILLQEAWNVFLLMTNFFSYILEKIHKQIVKYAIRNNVNLPLHFINHRSLIDQIEIDYQLEIELLQKEGVVFPIKKITLKQPFSIEGVEFGLLSPFRFFSGILFFFIISFGLRLTEAFTIFNFCVFCVYFFLFFFQLYLHSQEKNIDEEQYIGEWMRLYGLHNQVQKSRQIQKTKLEKFLDLKYTKFILGFSSVALSRVIGI